MATPVQCLTMILVVISLASCDRPAPPSLPDQAAMAVTQRLGSDYELHYVAQRSVAGAPVVCGYAGERGPQVLNAIPLVYTGGRLYLSQDVGSDWEGFLVKNCGTDLPRAPAVLVR